LFTGWVIDRFAESDFNSQRQERGAHLADGASFKLSCPGGSAAAPASAAARSTCHSTLVSATRRGMLVTLMFFGWACVHYWLASLGIVKSLRLASSVQSDSM
jgi:hypothetical protein